MIKKILTILLSVGVCSCNSITDNESKAIDEILEFYGGACKYSVGVVESTDNTEDKKYFEIELTNSIALTRYADRHEWTTSNIAYRFFKNLDQKERQNYTHIRGSLLFDNGEKIKHDYSIEDLQTVDKKISLVNRMVEIIEEKRFHDIKPYLNPENIFTYNKDTVVSNLQRVDPEFGNVTEFRMFGFKYTTADTKPILSIFGIMVRDVQNNEFKVRFNPKSNKEEILSLHYKW